MKNLKVKKNQQILLKNRKKNYQKKMEIQIARLN